jgi:tRNA-Thr(GGU) m(6)t(6)A37 methyltransferase TsaA
MDEMVLHPVGVVSSPVTRPEDAARQGDEGAPDCWIVLDPSVTDAAAHLSQGDALVVLTWLHRADRTVRQVHPRDDPARPLCGVFSTRSPDRPNPIGLHSVELLEKDGRRLHVRGLEAIDGTPVLDLKPALGPAATR